MSSTTGQAAAGAAVIPLASMAGSVPAQRVLSERPLRIALVAYEASGDLLGAGLVRELKARFPNAEFAGIGGDAMRSAGCQTWHDASELAVMGLTGAAPPAAAAQLRRRSASAPWNGSRTCSSASTHPTSTWASSAG